MHERWTDRTVAKDLDGLIEHIAPDIVSYEQIAPLQYVGIADVREVCRQGLASSPGRIDFDTPDLAVLAGGDLAVSWGLDRIVPDGTEPAVAALACSGGSTASGTWCISICRCRPRASE